ncbi:hypothetical protein Afil01_24740 [Actinorhabdospora filicis]|uniref:Intracellular septation protein A n=1 Tax=Actinorhabdospora filicis TaxID=1785913 RepID=A0A9W6SKL9_9ACTN|nr:hypothetical protein [Actinorhabdospora filicis]GLZ77667.1 hypothetical protein Afil01_24740 [Actinorhabdospora filicis]
MLRYVRTFLPWIAFAAITTNGEPRWGAIVGALLSVVFIGYDLRKGHKWDALIVEISSGIFLVGLAAATLWDPTPLGSYSTAISIAWLAATAWGSMLVKRPFTLGIAKGMVEPELHTNPYFIRAAYVFTGAWAIGFTLTAIALAVLNAYAPGATVWLIAIKVAGFGVPAWFTGYYRGVLDKRRAAVQAAMAAAE